MSENFEKLKRIGVQKIHEATHIPRVHIQSILNENFDDMNNVQLLGFIYVLEREYSLDLSDLKEKAKEYFKKNKSALKRENTTVLFTVSKKKRNFTLVYILLAVAVFVAFAFYNIQSKESEISNVDNSAIANAQNSISVITGDKNLSKASENIIKNSKLPSEPLQEQQKKAENPIEPIQQKDPYQNSTEPIKQPMQEPLKDTEATTPAIASQTLTQPQPIVKESNATKDLNETKEVIRTETQENIQASSKDSSKEVLAQPSLKIISKSKVWLGYIDLKNHRQNQKTFSGEFTLDASKNWLISLGHGFVDIEINGVATSFKKAQNIRFSYIDSKLKEIDTEEFKSLNRGTTW